jgi:internalin A
MTTKKFEFNEHINALEVDPRFLKDGLLYAEKKKYTAIRIMDLNERNGSSYDLDLAPFAENRSIRSLIISDNFKVAKAYIDAIYAMHGLKELSFRDKKIKPDFSRLSQLEALFMHYNGVPEGFSSLRNLTHLLMVSLGAKDCSMFKDLTALKLLRMSGGSFETLDGLEELEHLAEIRIDHCPQLNDVSAIGKLRSLKILYIEKCKRLSDFSCLSGNNSIEELFVSELDSIAFVSSMKNIKSLRFWSLTDGDINPVFKAKKLGYVYFTPNKKHYTHTAEEVKSLLEKS